ncbi:HEAT repeat domain-containing protein [Vampirovibrio sp.]|uniref:HEAT repeat domain-containing protein n=1 Tax=Vampirovibrio sp. TaxID=2717857 RepID=UPI003592FF66
MPDDTTPIETAINIVRQKEYPPSSRMNAILFMLEKFEPQCLPVLEEILKDPEEEPDVRSAAALALGKVGGDGALELLQNMAHSEDPILKNYSLQALGMTGREETIPVLLEALSDQDNTIFASAAEALGRIGKPVVPHLITLLNTSTAEDARCIAAWQLGTLRYTEAVPTLIEVIQADKNPEVIALAIWALGEIGFGPPEVLDLLQKQRAHEDPAINKRAEMAIKKITRHVN